MRIKAKNKTIITVSLLLLYAFIATPFNYWHHHKANCEQNTKVQFAQVLDSTSASVDSVCKVCSHHFSVALNDAVIVDFSPFDFVISFNESFILEKITNQGYGQSNRGPPSIV
jgi:hypothetical protein